MRPSETVVMMPGAAGAGRAAAPDKASGSEATSLIRRTSLRSRHEGESLN